MALSNRQFLEQLKHAQQSDNAIHNLKQLITQVPNQIDCCDLLAETFARLFHWQEAADSYVSFLEDKTQNSNAYFNRAYYFKQATAYEQAIDNYRLAIKNNISQPEEVYLNMAVIFSDHLRQEINAKEALETALKINNNYTPALYNLANLYEEEGNKEQASYLFNRVLQLEPSNVQSLARLADVKQFSGIDDPIISQLQVAVKSNNVDLTTKINLYYGLGKAFDDCGDYQRAFENYQLANQLDKKTMPAYDENMQQQLTNQNIQLFSEQFFSRLSGNSDEAPIFICGMFRSGSTLMEQILASHSSITAGGERDFFFRLANGKLSPYPEKMLQITEKNIKKISEDYLAELKAAFPDYLNLTDKRPDNFLYIGLIKSIFPKAKIIVTKRNLLDNCLSLYFLRLGSSMSYATDLNSIVHYYKEQARLLEHWKLHFPDTIIEADYDKLVEDPRSSVEEILKFLALEWEDNCLNFHVLKNRVKTASVWRVRQPLYKSSSGRWKNYEPFLAELIRELSQ